MTRYLRLLTFFVRASVIADLEYRINIVGRLISELLWYSTQIITFEVIFRHVPQLAGWSVIETRVFLGVLFLSDAINMLFFEENIQRISDLVASGELDLLLAKPVNSQFVVSMRRIAWPYLINISLILGWLYFALSATDGGITLYRVVVLGIMCGAAAITAYCIQFMLATISLFLVRAENARFIWYSLHRLAFRPDVIYPTPIRLILATILPMAFIASIPARVVLGFSGLIWLLAALAMAGTLLLLSHLLWTQGLRRYTSASS